MSFIQCSRCILDNIEVPDLDLSDGVCQYCRQFDRMEKERFAEKSNLPWVYDRLRKEGECKDYDVLLGLSGGVDSSMCLHYLVENGIRPLCFSVDNGYNDPKADENIMRLVEGMKVPFIRYTLNLNRFQELQSAFIQSGTKNIEIPTDHVLYAATYEMAKKYRIKNIISGGNIATEGVMPESYGYSARDLRFVKSVYKRFTKQELKGLPTLSLMGYLKARFIDGIKITNLLDYYDYNRDQSIKLLEGKYGWKNYGDKHCENKFTVWFQNYYLPKKFGLDKRKPHYSSLINSKQMTRSQALERMLEPLEYPVFGMEDKIMKYPIAEGDYRAYPNAEFWWKNLSKIYESIKN